LASTCNPASGRLEEANGLRLGFAVGIGRMPIRCPH